jgi:eukaryotic-like serine/threonine-protein kinase
MSHGSEERFAHYLLSHGYISDEELAAAQNAAAQNAAGDDVGDAPVKALAQALVHAQSVTTNQVRRVLGALKDESRTARAAVEIPGFEIMSRLGRGSQATVYKARQVSMDRIVALKILDKKVAATADFKDRFIKEARSAAALSHNNIVQAFDVGEHNGINYFVQEYVEGTTVADVMRERGRAYSETEALDIAIQMAEALAHAHSRGFIHRDVKPKNIMLTPEHIAKLADMGLARQASDAEAALAEAGKAFGTPYYIAPEQIRGNPNIDFRADIYSLGATLYQMITGRVPFEAPSPQGVMQKHLSAPLTPPDHINTSLSAGISEVIEVMMAKKPKDRYQATSDLLMDLQSVREGRPPALARQIVDAGGETVLAGLEEGEELSPEQVANSREGLPVPPRRSTGDAEGIPLWQIVALILAGLLALSVILNLYQAT